MLYNNIYDFVSKEIKQMENKNEETTKYSIVIPVLKMLGYDGFTFEYRKDHKNKIVDIFWKKKNDMLYIETKRVDNEITESDVQQLTVYMLTNNINWGILTNGRRYILINKDIGCDGHGESICMNRVVLDENVCVKNKKRYMKYFSKEYIFDNNYTNYFRDIAQYRVYFLAETNNENSWIQYQCTLYNFAEYLIKKHHKYLSLNYISFENFEDYWKDKADAGNKINSLKTYKAQYSHISSMFYTLHKNGKIIGNNNFAYVKTKNVKDLYDLICRKENINKNEFILDNKHVIEAIGVLSNKRDSNRDIIIILLSVYCGITLSEIVNLKMKDIDLEKNNIKLNDRAIPIPKSIKERLVVLKDDYNKKKVKTPNAFYKYYDKKYTAITIPAINYIFETLKEHSWAKCSLEKICSSLIPMLYKNGYSMEEISYLTGKSLNLLEKSIPYDEMIKEIKLDKPRKKRKHPFAEVLGM